MSGEPSTSPTWQKLQSFVVAAGIGTSVLFLVLGSATRLQMYGDGSIFSYAIAAQQAWAFHWHNISGRLFTYLFAHVPAETFGALTSSPSAGVALYGLLFFAAPLLGLAITWIADRSPGHVIFTYACLSTASLCPMVFGAPTEMWMGHALFWPALAVCLFAPPDMRGVLIRFVLLLALAFTHGGAVVLSFVILFLLFLAGRHRNVFKASVAAWIAVMAIWLAVKFTLRPDDYIAGVLLAHAYKFIDPWNLDDPVTRLLFAMLAGYGLIFVLLTRAQITKAHVYAALSCAAALMVYWFRFDTALLTEARYELRTALLYATPAFALLAVAYAIPDMQQRFPAARSLATNLKKYFTPQLIAGALALVLLVHTGETAKFLWGWTNYKTALRALATGFSADPALGDPLFVSSKRIGDSLNRLSWNSTTPYLSVLLGGSFSTNRLVVDPDTSYFWLSCATATASEKLSAALPAESRRLVRRYACLHRK